MNDQNRIVLVAAARMLSYPGEPWRTQLQETREIIREWLEPGHARTALASAMSPFFALTLTEAQELYVESFDWKEKTGLYLTAHEMGDSRKRGVALAELQQLIRDAGYLQPEGELPDYMPLLFELLAAADPTPALERLARRLAFAVRRMLEHLDVEHVYRPLFQVLADTVFDAYKDDDCSDLERDREGADLDPLPYPLMYG